MNASLFSILMNDMKGASTKVSSKSVLMMSGLIYELYFEKLMYFLVSQSESEQYKSEEALISWQKSLKVKFLSTDGVSI
jgi:hypothetical protein